MAAAVAFEIGEDVGEVDILNLVRCRHSCHYLFCNQCFVPLVFDSEGAISNALRSSRQSLTQWCLQNLEHMDSKINKCGNQIFDMISFTRS